MNRRLRLDRSKLKSFEERSDGVMFATIRVAKPGVLTYREDVGLVREYVPPETLYDPESLKSLGRTVLTDTHPRDEEGNPVEVSPENVKDFQAGDVGREVVVDEDGYVTVKVAIRDKEAQRGVKSGDREEASPGYHADLDDTPGTAPDGTEYDRVQTKRDYNHVALEPQARGGPDIRVTKVDGLGVQVDPNERSGTMAPKLKEILNEIQKTQATLAKFNADAEGEDDGDGDGGGGVSLPAEVRDALADAEAKLSEIQPALEKLRDQRDKMNSEIENLKGKVEALTSMGGTNEAGGERAGEPSNDGGGGQPPGVNEDGGQTRQDGADAALRFDSQEAFKRYQKERRKLEGMAEAFNVDAEPDDLLNDELKREIVSTRIDKDVSELSEARIDGAFDIIKAQHGDASKEPGGTNYDRASAQSGQARQDGRDDGMSEEEAQAAYRIKFTGEGND